MPSDYDTKFTEDDLFPRDRRSATAQKVFTRLRESAEEPKEVIVTGVKIPFWDLVGIIVMVALACIPAAIIVSSALFLINLIFGISLATFFGE